MGLIWSPEALEPLLQHRSEDVQDWAIRKSLELYPAILGNQVIGLLRDTLPGTSYAILRRLAQMDSPVTDLAPLVELVHREGEAELEAVAGAILLRSGYSLLPREIELAACTDYAHVVGTTDQGFDLVLRAFHDAHTIDDSVLHGLANVCNFADLFDDLARAQGRKQVRTRAEYFRRIWEVGYPSRLQLIHPGELLLAWGLALENLPMSDSTPWKRGLLAELDHDRARLASLYGMTKESAPHWSPEESRFYLACLLCLERNEACRTRLIVASDMAGLWGAIVMKPWRGVPGQGLRAHLLSAKPEELLTSLSTALRQHYSYASYACDILNALDTPGRFALFLDVYEGKEYEDILAEEAGGALRKAGLAAIEFIIESYPRMSASLRTQVLFVLDSFPTTQVVDFCLEHFDEYMRAPFSEEFVSCLGKIASADFLPPLLQQWKEGEVGMGRAIQLISEIHGIENGHIDHIVRDVEKQARRPEDMLDKPISSFPLRCTTCGHTYHYELKHIYVDHDGHPVIGDIIQCKGCGSIETYEMNARTHLAITAELVRLAASRKALGEKEVSHPGDSPIKLDQRMKIQAFGQRVDSIGEGYRRVKGELEKHLQDATLQRRMGNVLRNGGRPDLALPYYLEAVRLDPKDAESCFCVADTFLDKEQYGEAIPWVERLVILCRESEMGEDVRRRLFSALINQVGLIHEKTGYKVELFPLAKSEDLGSVVTLDFRSFDPSKSEDFEWLYHTFRYGRAPQAATKPQLTPEAVRPQQPAGILPAVRQGKRVGRNDPCPCSSGKKYKKCCGR